MSKKTLFAVTFHKESVKSAMNQVLTPFYEDTFKHDLEYKKVPFKVTKEKIEGIAEHLFNNVQLDMEKARLETVIALRLLAQLIDDGAGL